MDLHLVVVRPFAGLARGDIIADPQRIAAVLAGEHAVNVIRVHAQSAAPAATEPAEFAVNKEG